MATRIGVDIGGTFTDLIFYDDETGDVRVAKTATTPRALEQGVLTAVRSAVPSELVSRCSFFLHGTTIGLNALLTRSGARTGLLSTRGFRDVIEIGRGDRTVMYDVFWKPPVPLVPRRHRLAVGERIRADGLVLEPVDHDEVLNALATFTSAGIEAIAVCFINAYVNPAHELEVEQVLRGGGFDGEISLSHNLSREYREFERTSTTLVDAYIRPATARYLHGLRAGLAEEGFGGQVLVTRSGGGAITAEELGQRPFEAIQSGPVAGVEGAAELCRAQGWRMAITADVGGTSFDTALIVDGRPQIKHEGSLGGWPLQTQWVDVVSIGAGGGSIAYAEGGLLRVGPQSAGSVPGPACYGRGGREPTVTDAAAILGMFGDGVLSESLTLDISSATRAMRPVADALEMSVEDAARGVVTVASASMAEAIREITIGQGEDPRDARLVTFGGAGPLFGTLLAGELDVREVVVPPFAGNFSAWGLLGQDITHAAARTLFRVLSPELLPELNGALAPMFAELQERHDAAEGSLERIVGLDLRYVGQEHTLTVSLETGDGGLGEAELARAQTAFTRDYERRFGTTLDGPLELVTARASTRQRLPRKNQGAVFHSEGTAATRPQVVRSYSFAAGDWRQFAVRERSELSGALDGPAIVFEPTATTYLDAGFTVEVDASNVLLIRPSLGEGGAR